MSAIKLFHIAKNKITELEGKSVSVEKSLQALIEVHLEGFLGIKFLASCFFRQNLPSKAYNSKNFFFILSEIFNN